MSLTLPWQAALNWLLPCYCAGCAQAHVQPAHPFCYQCLSDLNESAFDEQKQQAIEKIFWGRIPLCAVITAYPLRSGSKLQQAIHQLKYHHRPDIGKFLGRVAFRKATLPPGSPDLDALIPLPLHPQKKRKRGYNQAEQISKGISAATGIPVWNDLVMRNQATETQTKKDRGQRWENMQGKFALNNIERAIGKHLLLVDDVLTTGATLESCGHTLLQIPGVQLSFFTIGFTENG
jgi:ComF family protein